jgi:hypothetical protein
MSANYAINVEFLKKESALVALVSLLSNLKVFKDPSLDFGKRSAISTMHKFRGYIPRVMKEEMYV